MSLIRDNMAPLMFVGMILFMLIGYPAAFSLAATGLFFGFVGIQFGLISPDFLGNLTYHYLKHGLQLDVISHPAILGLLLVVLGFQTFGFTLLMEVAKRVISRSRQ